jgi:hypothetical protein
MPQGFRILAVCEDNQAVLDLFGDDFACRIGFRCLITCEVGVEWVGDVVALFNLPFVLQQRRRAEQAADGVKVFAAHAEK